MNKCKCGLETETKFLFSSSYQECLRCDVLSQTKTEEYVRTINTGVLKMPFDYKPLYEDKWMEQPMIWNGIEMIPFKPYEPKNQYKITGGFYRNGVWTELK